MSRPYPIIEYAQKIGKSTAELTTKDLCAFMKWWIAQPQRKDLLAMASNYKQDLTSMNKWREEKVEEGAGNETENETEVVENEVVCSMELTLLDTKALLWALRTVIAEYDLVESGFEVSLKGLLEGLEGV